MTMEVDEALCMLGKYGRWQILLYIVISISNTFPAAWHMLAIVFLGGIPPHRCKFPEGFSEKDIPEEVDSEGQISNSSCALYTNASYTNETIACPMGWEFTGDFGPTIVTEWNLVCDDGYLVEMTQTIMVVGVMIGAMFFSWLSDNIGRKPVFLFSCWAMVVVGTVTAFVTNYYFFVALRFIAGMLQQGLILTGFVMACELFPAKYRTFAGTAIEDFWALGMCLLALFAYLIRDWRYLQLLITLPGILTIALFWFLPESIPWLVANDRHKEAEEIIKSAAKFNGIEMPDKILDYPEEARLLDGKDDGDNSKKPIGKRISDCCSGFLAKLKTLFKKEKQEKPEGHVRYTLIDVFRHRRLTIYALIMCLLWFVNSLVYYGLSLSTGVSAGDRYMNFFFSGLVEIPAYTVSIFVLGKWGRRWPLCIFHTIAGVALGITLFIPEKTASGTDLLPLIITFNLIGKFGITGSFGTVFLYAPEIFPTTLRNQAMGVASVGGRLGNMLAPFASYIARIWPWLPGILFGSLSIGVGLLALVLPETLGRPLPQTIEDINSWTRTVPKQPKSERGKHELVEVGNDVKDAKSQDAL